MHPCPYCTLPMGRGANNRQRTTHCGAADCRRAYDRDRTRTFLQRVKAETGIRYEDRYQAECVCSDCGTAFLSRHRPTRCAACSQLLAAAASAAVQRQRAEERAIGRKQLVLAGPVRRAETLAFRLAAKRAEVAACGSRSKNAVYVGTSCHRCGQAFVVMRTNDLPRFCSRPCARSTAKVARRVKERAGRVAYSRRKVFERDKWRCQIPSCVMPDRRVKRKAQVPDPKAPVIDHIVPLAAGVEFGGVDASWNVQTAHFLCNSIKSASFVQPALALEVA